MKRLVLGVVAATSLFATTAYKNNYVDFHRIINKSLSGNIETIGNTVECVTNLKFVRSLSSLKNAECQNDYTTYYNNKYLTRPVNVLSNNPSIFNSSSATLKFPSTYKKIIWAAIFWQGHINNYSYQYSFKYRKDKDGYDKYYDNQSSDHKRIYDYISKYWHRYYHLSYDLPGNSADNIKDTNANKVTLFLGNTPYVIEADELDYKSDSRYFKNAANGNYATKRGVKYSAYAVLPQNIIDTLNSLASNNKEINVTVANIKTTFGLDEKLGDYGAWSLVVIYEEEPTASNFRNNEVFYGFKNIYKGSANNHLNISINNLVLPKNGDVSSKLSIFSAEGEYVNKGNENTPESVRINGEFLNENLPNYDKYNVFDGRLSDDIERYPKLADNNGIDIDVFDVSNQLTTIRDKEKSENPSRLTYNTDINVSTYNDGVFLSNIAFSTELYKPRVCYYIKEITDENGDTIFKDGKFLKDLNPTKPYNITLFIANMPQSDYDTNLDTAQQVQVYMDLSKFIYYPESTFIKNVNDSNFNSESDVAGDDLSSFNFNQDEFNWHLGIEANGIKGGNLQPSYSLYDDTNKAFVKFRGKFVVPSDTKTIDLNNFFDFKASFSTNTFNAAIPLSIPQCSKFDTTVNVYIPKTGSFNVVEGDFDSDVDPKDINNSLNALHTKIVNEPFDVKIVKLKDDNETLEDYKGIVRLDLIKNPQNEEECKTNYPIWNQLEVFNDEDSKKVTLSYDEANRNVRFRIRYFDFDFPQSCINLMNEVNSNSNVINLSSDAKMCASDLKDVTVNTSYNLAHCVANQLMSLGSDVKDWNQFSIANMSGVTKSKVNAFMQCIFNDAKSVCSRDNFAIRPYAFLAFGKNEYKRAGEDFNIFVKAVDELNYNKTSGIINDVAGVEGYNENINNISITPLFYKPTEDEIRRMNLDVYGKNDTNASRVAYNPSKGKFSIVNGDDFVNGENDLTLNYSEVGILTLKIAEKAGYEFAKVDEKDTNDSQRLIKPSTYIINKYDLSQRDNLLEFIPYAFITTVDYNTTTGDSWLYMSNSVKNATSTPYMAGFINYNIKAVNKNGEIVQNFTKTYFPDTTTNAPTRNGLKLNTTFDLYLDAVLNSNQKANLSFYTENTLNNTPIYTLNKSISLNGGKDTSIKEAVYPTDFDKGVANVKVYFNIDKNYTTPVAETDITLKEANTSTSWMSAPGATNVFKGQVVNKSINFKYGRIKITDAAGLGNEVNSTVTYEYWTGNKWAVNTLHTDSSFGDIKDYLPKNFITLTKTPIKNGREGLSFDTTHSLPYSVKVHYSIPDALWYHPLAKDYKDPSSTNLDCLTHPCSNVQFRTESTGWGGIGKTGIKYSETNRTSEINSTNNIIKANKKDVTKINW